MQKSVWIGVGAGLLVVAVGAVGIWVAGKPAQDSYAPRASSAPLASSSGAPVISASGALPVPQASPARSAEEKAVTQERRRRLSEVRAEFNALRAQGMKAPPEKMRALVDELEAASPPGFDPRYFQSLRSMLDSSAKAQALNAELQALGQGNSPRDMARKEAILAELRVVAERVSIDARNMQSYVPTGTAAPSPLPGGKAP